MLRFIVRRLLVTVPMVLVVVVADVGTHPARARQLLRGREEAARPPSRRTSAPSTGSTSRWYVQYGRMMGNILRLDFGNSLRYENESVNDILRRTVPVSAAIGTCAYLLALVVGITLGTLAALKQNSKLDYASMGAGDARHLDAELRARAASSCSSSRSRSYWLPPARWDGFPSWNLILPVLTLSAIYMAYIARLTRAGMLEVLRSDYIRTARAKGLTERQVVTRHALRGGLAAGRLVHGARRSPS